jgi:hypothetical protein
LVAQGNVAGPEGAAGDLKGMEKAGQRDDMQPMTAAQQAQYKTEYQAAKAKWASLTPQQKSATISAARSQEIKRALRHGARGAARMTCRAKPRRRPRR